MAIYKDIQMADLPIGVDLKGHVCAVTGAAGVLCSCISSYVAQAGAKVAVLDIAEDVGKQVAEDIKKEGGEAEFFYCNVLEKDSIQEAAANIEKSLGRPTMLINGAGGNSPKFQSG
jgi:NAD(P)-dependent dehydrogenase (short-subunit alcohol dehydrogenase family)